MSSYETICLCVLRTTVPGSGRASFDFGVLITISAQDTVVCCTVAGLLAPCDTIALSFWDIARVEASAG